MRHLINALRLIFKCTLRLSQGAVTLSKAQEGHERLNGRENLVQFG